MKEERTMEVVTQKLQKYKRHTDSLNLVFSYFDFRFQEIQNQISKNKETKDEI